MMRQQYTHTTHSWLGKGNSSTCTNNTSSTIINNSENNNGDCDYDGESKAQSSSQRHKHCSLATNHGYLWVGSIYNIEQYIFLQNHVPFDHKKQIPMMTTNIKTNLVQATRGYVSLLV